MKRREENPLRTALIKQGIIMPGRGPGTPLYPPTFLDPSCFDVPDDSNKKERVENLNERGLLAALEAEAVV